jgi:hypothetical protein
VATGIAVNAQKSFGENPAGQVGAQLAFDKSGDGGTLIARVGEKALEIFPNDLVEKRVLRLVASIFDGMIPERDRVKREANQRGNTSLDQNMSRPGRIIEGLYGFGCGFELHPSERSHHRVR